MMVYVTILVGSSNRYISLKECSLVWCLGLTPEVVVCLAVPFCLLSNHIASMFGAYLFGVHSHMLLPLFVLYLYVIKRPLDE